MTLEQLIETRDLTVRYGRRPVLDGLDVSVGPGVTALLGPNGAGKTTLLSVLAGMRPSRGSATIAGIRLDSRARRRAVSTMVGYLPQDFDLAGSMRVLQTVRYAAWCRGIASREARTAAERALEITDLTAKSTHRVRTLSGGERQRLGLACAVAHGPRVLLLDEPTVGLDPDQRVRFRGFLTSLAADSCILLATHLLDDVRIIGEQVIVLSSGRRAFEGTPAELAALGRPGRHDAADPLEVGYSQVLRQTSSGEC